jgi:hypothetical protein
MATFRPPGVPHSPAERTPMRTGKGDPFWQPIPRFFQNNLSVFGKVTPRRSTILVAHRIYNLVKMVVSQDEDTSGRHQVIARSHGADFG